MTKAAISLLRQILVPRRLHFLVLAALLLVYAALCLRRVLVVPLGCERAYADGRCEPPAGRPLRLYVGAPAGTRVWILHGPQVLATDTSTDDDGFVMALALPAEMRPLWVITERGGSLGVGRVRLAAAQRAPWLRQADQAWNDRAAPTPDLIARVTAHLQDPLEPADRAGAYGLLGAMQHELGRSAEACAALQEALRLAHGLELVSEVAWDVIVLDTLYSGFLDRAGEMDKIFKDEQALLDRYQAWQPWILMHHALVRQHLGDLGSALDITDEALRWALRLHDADAVGALHHLRAELYEPAGDFIDADKEIALAALPICKDVWSLEARAQLRLRAWQSRWPEPVPTQIDPRPEFTRAVALRRDECKHTFLLGEDLLGLAFSELMAGQTAAAQAHLREAEATLGDAPTQRRARAELKAELALAQGPPAEARALCEQLVAQSPAASPAQDPEAAALAFRARLCLGRAQDALGDTAAALRTYDEAQQLADVWTDHLPIGKGLADFLGRHEAGTALLLDLLHRRGRSEEALAVFRRARGRVLDTLLRWQQADAAPPLTDLRRGPGAAALRANDKELILGCHPARRGWLCLAADAIEPKPRSFRVATIDGTPAELADRLLGPLGPMLERAGKVRFLGYGAMRRKDIHLLPYGPAGQPLFLQKDVVYALEIPALPDPARAVQGPPRALYYVGDVNTRQPWIDAVTAAQRLLSPRYTLLPQRPEHIMDLLHQADLLFYFGHGLHDNGHGGLDDRLTLDAQHALSVRELLAGPSAPAAAVLLACAAGSGAALDVSGGALLREATPEPGSEGLTLASALLIKGSRFVIAAPTQLDVEGSKDLAPRLAGGDLNDPVALLRRLAKGDDRAAQTARRLRVYVR